MIDGAKLVAFVATTDPDRSSDFYVEVLGLTVRERTPYALVLDGGGTELRVTVVPERPPTPYTVLGWEVADIGAAVRDLVGKGVEFIRYDPMDQDELGVWTAPGGARMAWFTDPDGNVLSFSQP
jgi:catechol 2,3-dioxygenase-like lactoylglutathione lyase family enzyme